MRVIALQDFYFLLVVALIQGVTLCSSRTLREFVVRAIAAIAYQLSDMKRRLIEKNLSRAFAGKLGEDQKHGIIKGAFYEFWQELFLGALSKAENVEVREARIHGLAHLHGALKMGKGVILWESNGFGRRLLAKRILSENGFLIHQIHGANDLGGFLTENGSATWVRRRLIRRFFYRREERFVVEIINLPSANSLEFTRVLLNLLNRNAVLCVSGDGRTGQKLIPIEFLGEATLFAPGMISLAKLSGAPILPMFCLQKRTGAISLTIESPISIAKDADRERGLKDSLKEYAGLLEGYIRRYPQLYRNWHLLGKCSNDGVQKAAASERSREMREDEARSSLSENRNAGEQF